MLDVHLWRRIPVASPPTCLHPSAWASPSCGHCPPRCEPERIAWPGIERMIGLSGRQGSSPRLTEGAPRRRRRCCRPRRIRIHHPSHCTAGNQRDAHVQLSSVVMLPKHTPSLWKTSYNRYLLHAYACQDTYLQNVHHIVHNNWVDFFRGRAKAVHGCFRNGRHGACESTDSACNVHPAYLSFHHFSHQVITYVYPLNELLCKTLQMITTFHHRNSRNLTTHAINYYPELMRMVHIRSRFVFTVIQRSLISGNFVSSCTFFMCPHCDSRKLHWMECIMMVKSESDRKDNVT